MILIKEVTKNNYREFQGFAAHFIITARDTTSEGRASNIGILISEFGTDIMEFSIQLSNGFRTKKYRSLPELIEKEGDFVRFYYIEIKP